MRDGWGEAGAVAEGAAFLVHQGVAVVPIGEEQAAAHGRPLPVEIRVARHLEGSELGEEGLDAALVAVPVEEEGKENQEKDQHSWGKLVAVARKTGGV